MKRIFWFRRDLRLSDNPALNSAIKASGKDSLIPIYWLRAETLNSLSPNRAHSLTESLKQLSNSVDNTLSITGAKTAKEFAAEILRAGVSEVYATESFDPEGIAEQRVLQAELAKHSIQLLMQDSYYAVRPGTVLKPQDSSPYRVYTPFYKAWLQIGWEKPHKLIAGAHWERASFGKDIPTPATKPGFTIRAGEAYAKATFERFKGKRLMAYSENRNRADLNGTSKLSHALAHGEIHPRTLLAALGNSDGEIVFGKEIAWREFYADVLFHNPHTLDGYYEPRFAQMRYDTGKEAESKFERWKNGTTGFPMVDAGMRQLLAEGWMHNRVRMIVASFLVKDLHLEWKLGASWFEQNLTDYDPASNSHGWQWTAGCGTDASPYYRVFNPILQGYKFDPDGNYVRKYVPELSHIPQSQVHEPWLLIDGLANGYPEPMLDHSEERAESLLRLEEIKIK
ncbi:MAG: cryptochrome/photolyase family protein [Actinomycetota bacterium]